MHNSKMSLWLCCNTLRGHAIKDHKFLRPIPHPLVNAIMPMDSLDTEHDFSTESTTHKEKVIQTALSRSRAALRNEQKATIDLFYDVYGKNRKSTSLELSFYVPVLRVVWPSYYNVIKWIDTNTYWFSAHMQWTRMPFYVPWSKL